MFAAISDLARIRRKISSHLAATQLPQAIIEIVADYAHQRQFLDYWLHILNGLKGLRFSISYLPFMYWESNTMEWGIDVLWNSLQSTFMIRIFRYPLIGAWTKSTSKMSAIVFWNFICGHRSATIESMIDIAGGLDGLRQELRRILQHRFVTMDAAAIARGRGLGDRLSQT